MDEQNQIADNSAPVNPLRSHFRQPEVYLDLPSKGKFWNGGINMPPTGEVPVLSMNATDEITINTPDALLNGEAVVSVVESCVPCVTDGWETPSIDIDAILIAIRIASYGEMMTIEASCPKCSEENQYDVDLKGFLTPKPNDLFDEPIDVKDFLIYFQPVSYRTLNKQNQQAFEEQRLISMVNDAELSDEEKTERFREAFTRLKDISFAVATNSIRMIKIKSTDEEVTDREFIKEFINEVDRKVYGEIAKKINELDAIYNTDDINIKCDACGHEYSTPFVFDYSNFFV